MVMLGENGTLGVLFIDESEESQLLLSKLGEFSRKLQVINVDKNGLRGWLLMEYGTTEVPLLVTENSILSGVKSIEAFIEKLVQ